jgi:hypothetical protein
MTQNAERVSAPTRQCEVDGPGLATTRRAAGRGQLTNAALAAWFGARTGAHRQTKKAPGVPGGL